MKTTNKVWLANQIATQRMDGSAFPGLYVGATSLASVPLVIHRWLGIIPSWVLLIMIILAAIGTASAVTVRMRTEFEFSSRQYQQADSEVATLRRNNAALGNEIKRITYDPGLIETFARSRLGMVRPNDIVVPIQSVDGAALGVPSLVR